MTISAFLGDTRAALAGPLGLALGVLVLVVAALVLLLRRDALFLRRAVIAVVRLVYRLRIEGLEHLPASGGALLVANHVSYADACLIGASAPRLVRFLMYRRFFDVPLLGRLARALGALPVAASDGPRALSAALRAAAERAAAGELVCIFGEGSITRTGQLLPFGRGLEAISRRARVPIVPVCLTDVWGSIFSFHAGRAIWKLPQRVPYEVGVRFGEPLPPETTSAEVQAAIAEMAARALESRTSPRATLAHAFLRSARRHAREPALADSSGTRLTYAQLLRAALALRGPLARATGDAERVGVLLPPCTPAALANVALALAGRTSVNLNWTTGASALESAVRRARLAQVITSRRFLEALDPTLAASLVPALSPAASPTVPSEGLLPGGARLLFVEDLLASLRWSDRLRAALLASLPGAWLARAANPVRSAGEPATVIFSSGSTAEPKGVVLTHNNVVSNLEAVVQVFRLGPGECVLGVLPFFHSFGFTVALWAPLCSGAKVALHASALDARTVAKLGREERVTLLLSTPAFYQSWMRRCEREDFASVRFAVAGAQKLPGALADAWLAKFGFELHEGYGCTELSPVVCVNLPDVEQGGVRQQGSRRGTVGRPLPGVAVRVARLDSGAPCAPEEEGLLYVRGPNVMRGYLDDAEATARVLAGGWYATGDVGRIDRDGFVVLTDRLARFSKIAGEMVSHGRVEEALSSALASLLERTSESPGLAVPAFAVPALAVPALAVIGVEDGPKGERLAVLHEPLSVDPERVVERARASGLPNLFLPRAEDFVEVGELPRLASGKLDLRRARALASERVLTRRERATQRGSAPSAPDGARGADR